MSGAALMVREPAPSGPDERALWRLWSNAHNLAEGLMTEDGRRLRVVYPGRYSTRAGPDFRDAVLADEHGDLIRGDVEVHLDSSGWRQHGHHVDRNYNGVVLHVVLHPKGAVVTGQQSKGAVPVASIAPLADELEHARSPETPPTSSAEMAETLDRAGDQRFLSKSRGFQQELRRIDREQVLYEGLMEALGYATNRKGFRELARLATWPTLALLRTEPSGTRIAAVKAILLKASGLLHLAVDEDEEQALRGLAKGLTPVGSMPLDSWRLFRVRPANHPARRVLGAVQLVDRYLGTGLSLGLKKVVESGKAKALTDALEVRPYVGQSRAREMAVNVVLPYFHALSGLTRRGESSSILELYRRYPRLPDNDITREMVGLLAARGDEVKIKGARRQQGLIEMYRTMTSGRGV